MKKRILLITAAVIALAIGVVGMSAFEAHVINVTAHIENALNVATKALDFGTVFPQEFFTDKTFTVDLSSSFIAEDRVDDVNYVIKQKPKCKCDKWVDEKTIVEDCPEGQYAPVGYATHECPEGYTEMLSLCPFLSKTDGDPADGNDTSHAGYFIDPTPADPNSGDESCVQPERITSPVLHYGPTGWGGWSCPAGTHVVGGGYLPGTASVQISEAAQPGSISGLYPVYPHYTYTPPETGWVVQNDDDSEDITIFVDCLADNPDASGKLWKHDIADLSDTWIVDLKVPPFEGYVGQDWPEGCPVLQGDPEGTDLGCDLWVEVTGISNLCGNGLIDPNETCELPNTTDNSYCVQTTSECFGPLLGVRDGFGNCDGVCGCVEDLFRDAVCVKNSCGATCAVDADCDDGLPETIDTCNTVTCSCENID
jgi:hypothetical protein